MSTHTGVTCDFCQSLGFAGRRFKCRTCFDYDLCESCFKAGHFNKGHSNQHSVWVLLTQDGFDKELTEFRAEVAKSTVAYEYPVFFANLSNLVTVQSPGASGTESQTIRSDGACCTATSTKIGCVDKLENDLKKLMLCDSNSCDVKFIVRGRTIRAHRTVLEARSPNFASMFQHDKALNSDVINITDFSPEAFQTFLTFLYSANIRDDLTQSNVVEVYELGNEYLVDELKDACRTYMAQTINADVFCDYLTLAQKHADLGLLKCANKFYTQNVKAVYASQKFKKCLTERPFAAIDMLIATFDAARRLS